MPKQRLIRCGAGFRIRSVAVDCGALAGPLSLPFTTSGAWAPPLPPWAVKGMRGRAFSRLVAAGEAATAFLIAFDFSDQRGGLSDFHSNLRGGGVK